MRRHPTPSRAACNERFPWEALAWQEFAKPTSIMSEPEDPKANAVVMTGIAKSFGGVAALEHVDFSVRKGEIHALLGGNGAGKSTVLKMLSGVHKPDKGEIYIGGVKLEEHTPDAARRLGIALIFQEMSLMPSLSVSQNIF